MKYALSILICLLLVACRTSRTEPTVVYNSSLDTVRLVTLQYDSIYLHDSIFVNQYIHGDTVFRDRDRWHTLYKYIQHTDTVYESRIDSIPIPYQVIVEKRYIPKFIKCIFASVLLLMISLVLFRIAKSRL